MTYFTIEELTASATARRRGIVNAPTIPVTKALEALVDNVLDPLRKAYGKPIIVTSGYRCPLLNKAVGGVSNSQHLKGEAADIVATTKLPADNKKIFDLAKQLNLPFDQLIDEHGYQWIHISFTAIGKNRGQVLHLR